MTRDGRTVRIKGDGSTRSFVTGSVACQASVTLVPLIAVAVERRFGTNATASGAVLTAHLMASFIGGAIISIRLPRARRATYLAASCAVGGVASAAALAAWSVASIAVILVVSGAAFGVGSALANAALPRLTNPMKSGFSAASWSLATGAVVTAVVPNIDPRGRGLIFVAIGLLSILLAPAAMIFPSSAQRAPAADDQFPEQSQEPGATSWPKRGRPPLWMPIGTALLFGGDTALYAFALDFGKAAGLSDQDGGVVLGVGLVVGLLVTLVLTRWVPKRHVRLLVISSLAITLLKAAIGFSTATAVFTIVILAWNGLYLVAFTSFAVTAARLDQSGRLGAVSAAASFAGSALGPILMGVAIDSVGLRTAGVAAGLTSLFGMAAALVAVSQTKRAIH